MKFTTRTERNRGGWIRYVFADGEQVAKIEFDYSPETHWERFTPGMFGGCVSVRGLFTVGGDITSLLDAKSAKAFTYAEADKWARPIVREMVNEAKRRVQIKISRQP